MLVVIYRHVPHDKVLVHDELNGCQWRQKVKSPSKCASTHYVSAMMKSHNHILFGMHLCH
jgi:hypothetical protein